MRAGRYRLFLFLWFLLAYPVDVWAAPQIAHDPYLIFHNYLDAIGGLARIKAIKTAYSEGQTVYDGLEGRFTSWEEKPLKYRLDQDYTVIALAEGDDGSVAWQKDVNGQVVVLKDEETQKRRHIKKLLENFEHINPHSPYFSLAFDGQATVTGAECLVVKMVNTINDDILYYYFDPANFRLIKTFSKQPDVETSTTYGDYRQVEGVFLPFYADSHISPRDKREVTVVSSYRLNPDVGPGIFAVPEQSKGFAFPAGGKSLDINIKLVENMLYLPVLIGDETTIWVLDSGASLSVIDADFAARLGLIPLGEVKGFGFGDTFALSFITLPQSRVGEILVNPRKVYVYKGLAENSYEPRIHGILGYDFLSRFVTRIDYANRMVSFFDPATFSYTGDGVILEAPLKYQTFTVPVVIDGQLKGNFSLDLGSYVSSFHYQYAEKHKLHERNGVLAVSRGLAGELVERVVPFKSFTVGGFTVTDPLLTIPLDRGKGAAAVGEQAGNLGYSILRHFVVYLDYARQQVILEKGKDFNRSFPVDRSGLIIGRSAQGGAVVVFVALETPAAKAGFLAGDMITAVDGVDVVQYGGILPIMELLRQKAGTEHHFKISRAGREENLTIRLAELYWP